MKKKELHFPFFSRITILFIVLLATAKNSSKAQLEKSNENKKILISFNDSLTPEQLGIHKNDQFDWIFRNDRNELIADHSKGSIFSYRLDQPGNYSLSVRNVQGDKNHFCSHHGFSGFWEVEVSPVNIKYDVNSITFSKELTSENLMSGVEVSIPVEVSFKDNVKIDVTVSSLELLFQGVDCEVKVFPKNPNTILTAGKSIITFDAKGISRKQSYIMIDCIDHNGKITTYYHPNEL